MPSPFPGMDPYLEHPDLFPGLHDRFITYIGELLQPQLPPPYLADIGRRAWLEISERYMQPDVEILTSESMPRGKKRNGDTAVLAPTAPAPVIVHVPHDEWQETYLEIFIGRGRQRRLITVIEILSLSNKTPGQDGRDLYQRKQREVLESGVNLVEIDLLRAGRHTTAVPDWRLQREVAAYDYHVCIHRADQRETFYVYPILIQQALPRIEIPLLPEHGSVAIDLQTVFNRCYDTGPYSREIDYALDEPVPPLSDEQVAFRRALLAQRDS